MLEIKRYGYRHLKNVLVSVAVQFRPKHYLEIGVREGDSIKALITHHKPLSMVVCDTWGSTYGGSGRGNPKHIIELLKELRYEGECIFLNGQSQDMIPQLEGRKKFDLILVDGDHSYKGAYTDLVNCWKILNPGGHIIFDDVVASTSPWLYMCAQTFLRRNKDVKLLYYDYKDNGVMVFQK